MPSLGQCASAEASASCIASSARSKEPETRISPAMTRPNSARKTDSTARSVSPIRSGERRDRADLDAPLGPAARRRDAPRPVDRLVQVRAFEEVVAPELLLRLRERAVGREELRFADAHRARRRRRLERLSGPVVAARPDALGERVVLPDELS